MTVLDHSFYNNAPLHPNNEPCRSIINNQLIFHSAPCTTLPTCKAEVALEAEREADEEAERVHHEELLAAAAAAEEEERLHHEAEEARWDAEHAAEVEAETEEEEAHLARVLAAAEQSKLEQDAEEHGALVFDRKIAQR
jgi:hypothetical protein